MKTIKKHWTVGLLAALAIGSAVGISAARALVPGAPTGIELPALDRMVTQLAANARGAEVR